MTELDDTHVPVEAHDAEAGLALVEVLVALALLALISLLLVETLRGGGRAIRAMERDFAQLELRQVREYLEEALVSALPHAFFSEDTSATLPLHGGRQSLAFVTNHTVAGQYAGIYVTRLTLRPGKDGLSDLWLDQHLYHRYSTTDYRVSPRVRLLRNVARLHFRYFGATQEGSRARWHDTWRHPHRLPDAVALVVEFGKNDPRYWPVLIASPRTSP